MSLQSDEIIVSNKEIVVSAEQGTGVFDRHVHDDGNTKLAELEAAAAKADKKHKFPSWVYMKFQEGESEFVVYDNGDYKSYYLANDWNRSNAEILPTLVPKDEYVGDVLQEITEYIAHFGDNVRGSSWYRTDIKTWSVFTKAMAGVLGAISKVNKSTSAKVINGAGSSAGKSAVSHLVRYARAKVDYDNMAKNEEISDDVLQNKLVWVIDAMNNANHAYLIAAACASAYPYPKKASEFIPRGDQLSQQVNDEMMRYGRWAYDNFQNLKKNPLDGKSSEQMLEINNEFADPNNGDPADMLD